MQSPPSLKIKIGMVLDQPFPPDARVEREAMALVAAGYEVHLLCAQSPDTGQNEPREEFYQGIYVHRVQPDKVHFRVPFIGLQTRLPYTGAIKSLCHSIWNRDNAWFSLIDRFVQYYGIQILHIHDLRLLDTGLMVARWHQLPVVADLHENYPALMEMLKGKQDAARGNRQRRKWEQIEMRGTLAADRVITVIEEARERLLRKGVPPEKVALLPNTVDIEKFTRVVSPPALLRHYKPYFVLTYVGHINSHHRGIHTVIKAMGLLKDEMPELIFVGAGAVRDSYFQELQLLIEQYGVADRVQFTGWLDEQDFVPYIEASDICLCPHEVTDHTQTTFPNKVYLYHLFRRAVIVSNCAPLERYIGETQGGLSFESGNAEDLAGQIRRLYHDKSLRRRLAENGQQAVCSHFNWAQTAPVLVNLYGELSQALTHGAAHATMGALSESSTI